MKDRMRCRFFNALQTIYFCKDRKYENDSERVFAESALRKLWEYDEITVAGVRYTRREIRKAMFDEMIPETHAHGFEKGATFALLAGFLLVLVLQRLLAGAV